MTATRAEFAEYCANLLSDLPANVRKLIDAATLDLYSGPMEAGEESEDGFTYPGFTSAVRAIRDALDDVGDVWIDSQSGEVLTSEPDYGDGDGDGDGEDFCPCYYPEDICHYDRKYVIRQMIGHELASYV